jgi:RNA polymerase sigma factor (sigma-70 family)
MNANVLPMQMIDRDPKQRLAYWFRQWRVPLRRFLVGRGTVRASDLDDVAQEVFLRLMRYQRTEIIENPQAYLYKMAANVAAEWAIRSRNSRPHEPRWLLGLATEEPLFDGLDQKEIQDEIERALLTLTPRQREVLKLQFFSGLRRTQIAERLGTSERTVKRILTKSYQALRRQLNAELLRGITHGRE